MCHRCILKVNQFCEFIKSCIRAESKLKDLLEIENCEKNYKIIDTGCDLTENLLQKLTEGSLQKTPNFTPESSISTTVQTPEPVVNKILDSNLSDSKTLKFSNKPNDNEIEILFNEKSQNNYTFNEVSQCSKIKELNFDKNIKIEKRYSKLLLMDQSSSDTKIKTVSFF